MDRKIISRLHGTSLDGDAAVLLVNQSTTGIEFVVTEEHASDAIVFLSYAQVDELTRKLAQVLRDKSQ